MELADSSRILAAILVFGLVTVETGGMYLVSLVRGDLPATQFQLSFSRAGHAHAGVLLTLSLVVLLLADAGGVGDDPLGVVARSGVPVAALLMPAGFFFSSLGRDVTEPNGWISLLWLGAASLTAGLVALGVGLLTAG